MKNILILGGTGYIGTRLGQVLGQHHNVKINDICWYNYDSTCDARDYHKLSKEELEAYDAIVVLAGHSSVKSCIGDIASPWLNNVSNFTDLLDKIDDQLIIYASSSSVYGNSNPGTCYKETDLKFIAVNNYDVTKYALDLHAELANRHGKKVIGLRFGTVNGWSPNLRADVMINSMYVSAKRHGKVTVTNKNIHRALLGLEDLCRAVLTCIERPVPGIYNLSSFNTTVEDVAAVVASKLGATIEDCGNTRNVYDFMIDSGLFINNYDFTFLETPAKIVDGLIEHDSECRVQFRNDYMIYNREPKNGLRSDYK